MKAPAFWQTSGPLSRLLAPIAALYQYIGRRRLRTTPPYRGKVPVVCVGNITLGGTGKTPVTLALVHALQARGMVVHCLSRGYGGREAGPLRVDLAQHTAADVGDEPLLLAQVAPAWISRNRAAGSDAITSAQVAPAADVIVMDDGFQNPTLHKDFNVLVFDGGAGLGNGKVFPAGPLREIIADAAPRVQQCILMGEDRYGLAAKLPPPVLHAQMQPLADARKFAGQRVVAFCGIGRPDKFLATLQQVGATVLAFHKFADHHPYDMTSDIQPILDEAYALNAIPVTTAKDAVRIPGDQRAQVDVVHVGVQWQNQAAFDALVDQIVAVCGRFSSVQA
jgi:tetraacyldisaccharide 4'-kinase